jgi:hypothetical protein
MANQSLISGEKYAVTGGNQQGGFIDIADTMSKPLQQASEGIEQAQARRQAKIREEEAKAKAIDAKIGGYIGKMKSNVDLVGISAEQQKAIQGFLLEQKAKYVEAANAIVNYSASDPEYLRLSEVMQGVNNSFVNLSNNLKVYKENQINFVDDFDNGMISNGDVSAKERAGTVYDPSSPFGIDNGDLIFDIGGEKINYRDFKNPGQKAFKTADAILKITNSLYSRGQKLTPSQETAVRNQLDEQLSTNPDAIKSLISDKLLTNTRLDIDPNIVNDAASAGELKELVLDKLMSGLTKTAEAGYSEAQRKQAISENKKRKPMSVKVNPPGVVNGETKYSVNIPSLGPDPIEITKEQWDSYNRAQTLSTR